MTSVVRRSNFTPIDLKFDDKNKLDESQQAILELKKLKLEKDGAGGKTQIAEETKNSIQAQLREDKYSDDDQYLLVCFDNQIMRIGMSDGEVVVSRDKLLGEAIITRFQTILKGLAGKFFSTFFNFFQLEEPLQTIQSLI